MAEVDTQMLVNQHADIRREGAEHAAEVRYDIATKAGDIRHETAVGFDKAGDLVASTASDIRLEQQKQAFDLSRQSGSETNEVIKEGLKSSYAIEKSISDSERAMIAQAGIIARDTADLRAQLVQAIDTTKLSTELNALKSIIEGQKNTGYLSDKITADGDRTRGLINDLKYHDLNRALVERNAELVEEREGRRHWRGMADQNQFGAQFAQLQSMMQNFNSQLADTRQGMVNFGSMAGVGQTSTSNNVR